MSFTVSEFGGLAVAFSPIDQRQVQAALTRLDPGLFLDPEVEPYGPHGKYVYLTVKHHVGSGLPPVPILEWRDQNGPWPLTMEIVERVKRNEGAGERAIQEALRRNAELRRKAAETVGEQAFDVGLDARKATGKTSALLPRGQGLRMARDRARAKGRKA